MKGAIIGDITGSVYEFSPVKSKDIELFPSGAEYTDDTVLTIAVADAILHKSSYKDSIVRWGRLYPSVGYGNRFRRFLSSPDPQPYNSFGNGSAMRVSPVGWSFNTEAEVLRQAKLSAEVSHDHPEGIKGAQSVALAIFLARQGASKEAIRKKISHDFQYDLTRTTDEIRDNYSFHETCQRSVPESIISFLDSVDFEDAIRNAISLGGDADTQAAIAGSIAEAYYGQVPEELWKKSWYLLTPELKEIIDEFTLKYSPFA